MTIKIYSKGKHDLELPIAKVLKGKNGKRLRPALEGLLHGKLEAIATRHYQNMLVQVGHVLRDPGVLTGTGGGSRTVPYKDGENKGHRIHTVIWPALTARYVATKPISRRMWHKRTTKSLSARYGREIRPQSKKATVARGKVDNVRVGNHVRVHYVIDFSKLPNRVVNTLLAAPFVVGRESPANGFKAHSLNRNSSELMGYPEKAQRKKRKGGKSARRANRPLVARLSSSLGQDMHRAIRKL